MGLASGTCMFWNLFSRALYLAGVQQARSPAAAAAWLCRRSTRLGTQPWAPRSLLPVLLIQQRHFR